MKLFTHFGHLYYYIEQASMAFEACSFPKAFQHLQTMTGLLLFDEAG